MTTTRRVYPTAELAGPWELSQPVPVDGSGYNEPALSVGSVFAYTAEDDSAPALQANAVTIPAGASVGDVAVVWAAVTDETETALVATPPSIAGLNEQQTLSSDRTGGTFTLTFGGDTTGPLQAANETAANVQTALEALAAIGVGQVACSGGPLDTDPIVIEFTGTLAETDVALLTVTDSGTGGTAVAVAETVAGEAATAMTLETSVNIPAADGAFQPQMHVWRHTLTAGQPGRTVDVTHADHGALRSIASGCVTLAGVDTGTVFESTTVSAGAGTNFADLGSVTPTTEGAKVVALLAKAIDGGAGTYYSAPDSPSEPSGLAPVQEAQADAMSVSAWLSGPLPASQPFAPSDAAWNIAADWAGVMLVARPNAPASVGATLAAVTETEDVATWIDITAAAGNMFEVLEVDMAAVPAGAIITSAGIEIGHSSQTRNYLRATLVGINPDGTIDPCVEQQPDGYLALPLGQVATISTTDWRVTASGQPLSSFTRFGVALISARRNPFVTAHRVFWARVRLSFDEGGPIVTNVAGPASPGDPVTWTYSSSSGLAQTGYQVRVIAGAGQNPDSATVAANPLDPATGEIVADTGRVASTLDRSDALTGVPIARGDQTVAVRAFATSSAGIEVVSDWDTADFNVGGAAVGGTQAVEPVYNPGTGGVDVPVTVPAGVSRAWLLRSDDSGVTYQLTEGSPFTVTPSTVATLTDYYAPTLVDTLRYQVAFDDGATSETSTPVQVGSGADVSTPAASWLFRVDDDPELNTPVFIRSFTVGETVRSQVALQGATETDPARAVVATSRTLATTLTLEIWVTSGAERRAVAAVIRSGHPIRVSDVWGREWLVRPVQGQGLTPRRAKGNLSTSRPLRDLHVIDVELVGSTISE